MTTNLDRSLFEQEQLALAQSAQAVYAAANRANAARVRAEHEALVEAFNERWAELLPRGRGRHQRLSVPGCSGFKVP